MAARSEVASDFNQKVQCVPGWGHLVPWGVGHDFNYLYLGFPGTQIALKLFSNGDGTYLRVHKSKMTEILLKVGF